MGTVVPESYLYSDIGIPVGNHVSREGVCADALSRAVTESMH
jgi:uncharacterized protein YijF (DUF1287 family)